MEKVFFLHGHDQATTCFLDYTYLIRNCQLQYQQKALDADSKGVEQVNFTGDWNRAGNTIMVLFLKN